MRIDADVLAWLRMQGKGYQSRINAILRRKMLAATQSEVGDGFREEGPSGKSGEIGRKRGDTLGGVLRKR